MPITPRECRAARALLDWSQEDLAIRADLGKRTVMDFESGKRSQQSSATLAQIKRTFEDAGVAFQENGILFPPKGSIA